MKPTMRASTARLFILASMVACQGLAGIDSPAQEKPRLPVTSLNADHLGESLKSFLARHREAKCHRRPSAESDELKLKEEWLTWVDCGLEKGIKFKGLEILAEVNPSQPFGMFATFHEKKLVDLSYILAIPSINILLPTLREEFGSPSQILSAGDGDVESVTWVGQTASLVLEFVPLPPIVAERHFLRMHSGPPIHAVRVRICLNSTPPSGT